MTILIGTAISHRVVKEDPSKEPTGTLRSFFLTLKNVKCPGKSFSGRESNSKRQQGGKDLGSIQEVKLDKWGWTLNVIQEYARE